VVAVVEHEEAMVAPDEGGEEEDVADVLRRRTAGMNPNKTLSPYPLAGTTSKLSTGPDGTTTLISTWTATVPTQTYSTRTCTMQKISPSTYRHHCLRPIEEDTHEHR
jgi:hypothetical protein